MLGRTQWYLASGRRRAAAGGGRRRRPAAGGQLHGVARTSTGGWLAFTPHASLAPGGVC